MKFLSPVIVLDHVTLMKVFDIVEPPQRITHI